MGSGLERAEYDYPEPVSYSFVAPDPYNPDDDDDWDAELDDDEMDDETWDDDEDEDEAQKEWDEAIDFLVGAMQ